MIGERVPFRNPGEGRVSKVAEVFWLQEALVLRACRGECLKQTGSDATRKEELHHGILA